MRIARRRVTGIECQSIVARFRMACIAASSSDCQRLAPMAISRRYTFIGQRSRKQRKRLQPPNRHRVRLHHLRHHHLHPPSQSGPGGPRRMRRRVWGIGVPVPPP